MPYLPSFGVGECVAVGKKKQKRRSEKRRLSSLLLTQITSCCLEHWSWQGSLCEMGKWSLRPFSVPYNSVACTQKASAAGEGRALPLGGVLWPQGGGVSFGVQSGRLTVGTWQFSPASCSSPGLWNSLFSCQPMEMPWKWLPHQKDWAIL